jgi:gliding motility-associated-like protein
MMNENYPFIVSLHSLIYRHLFFYFIFFFFLPLHVIRAQECVPDNSGTAIGCFTINATYNGITQTDISRVCLGTEIQVIQCKPSKGDNIFNVIYDYDDSVSSANPTQGALPPVSAASFTYTLPGTYTILQRGSGDEAIGVGCISLRKQIVVLPIPEPEFSLTTCTGQKVILNIPPDHPNNPYETYVVNWGDGSAPQTISSNSAQHTYLTGGVKSVTVTGGYQPGGCGSSTTKTVTPANALTLPQLRQLTVKDNAEAELELTLSAEFPGYEIYQRIPPASYQPFLTLSSPTNGVVALTGLNNQTTTYCYKVVASDACGQTLDLGEVCTVRLEATAQNNQNLVRWPVYSGPDFQSYQLYRDNRVIRVFTDAQNIQFIDTEVKCSRNYCYALEIKTGTTHSLSQTECVTAISDTKPTVPENITATVLNGSTVLAWKKPEQFTVRSYKIERSENGGPFRVYGQIASTNGQFLDAQSATDTLNFCYRISYADSCGNVSDASTEACPIRLKKTNDAVNPQPYEMEWSPYQNWPAGVKAYVLEWLDAKGLVRDSVEVGLSLKYAISERDTLQQVLYFRVKAVSNDVIPLISYSNVIMYVQEMRVYLPDAFTPNKDGTNDLYEAKGLFIRDFRMQIFNRWGQLLFVGNSIEEGWDGTHQGAPAPPTTYVCKMEAFDFRGKMITKNKIFVLIR